MADTSTALTKPDADSSPAECFAALMDMRQHSQPWRIDGAPGRPSKYDQALVMELCHRVANGETITSIAKEDHMPHLSTIYSWLYRYPQFAKSYAYARQMQSHSFIGKAVDAADRATGKDDASAAKVKADTYLKVASRINPEEYGERRENSNALQINIQTNLDDPVQLATQRGEYRLVVEDAEIVDTSKASSHEENSCDVYLRENGIEF